MSQGRVDRRQLTGAFAEIGLQAGDSVLAHSSLRSLGRVEGGPETVIAALLEVLGPEGNLMLPTFNYSRPLPDSCFDPARTPCRTGIIPETARQRPDALRSLHPTHSVTVIGRNAQELTQDHLATRTFGIGSPIDRLAKRGGKILLLGVGHTSNSTIHVAEEYAGLPKASWYETLPVLDVRLPNGEIVAHSLDTSPSCSAAFGGAELCLRRHGAIRDGYVNGSLTQLMRAEDVIIRVAELLREQPDALLCTRPGCRPCTGARQALRAAGRL
jgi:aminoglycoside 3-N-acetyltransferase